MRVHDLQESLLTLQLGVLLRPYPVNREAAFKSLHKANRFVDTRIIVTVKLERFALFLSA